MLQSNLYAYLEQGTEYELLLCQDDREAVQASAIATLLGYTPFVLPDLRLHRGEDLRPYSDELQRFLLALQNYYKSEEKKLLIAPLRTFIVPFVKADYFNTHSISFGDKRDREAFKSMLYHWGYTFVDIAVSKGEVSFRGDIVDIYPIDAENPYRISFFDNEVESISHYDETTQKRLGEELESCTFPAAFLSLTKAEHEALEVRVSQSQYESFVRDIPSLGLWYLETLAVDAVSHFDTIAMVDIAEEIEEVYSLQTPTIEKQDLLALPTIPTTTRYRDLEVADVNKLLETHKEKEIILIAKSESVIRSSELLSFENTTIVYQEGSINLLGPDKIILSLNKPSKRKKVKKASIILDELNRGDYVVHENHGVGIFKGIEKREVLGATSEFMVIQYQGEDILLIPVSSLEVIDRYLANSGSLPILDKLGKASFKKLKGKVKEKLFAIASDIINLSAQRHLKQGIVLRSDIEEHALFMAEAGFVHTEDQEKSIFDMLKDLSSGKMMDRLLSADVGFGKTEVAMNGLFVAVKSGYQGMMIAPTTLLSAQHYKTLQARFEPFKIRVAKLDRFTSAKEKKAIVKGLEEGSIDVVVGTHALLKVTFKNLALVVIDEEHRFGVRQKEVLKEMAIDIHLLSMSATPIPRSLNMALSHLKSFSEILTPPLNRQGVRTFVKNYDEKIIKEAILRELRRGGQLFYVYNSIAGIEEKKEELLEILPDLRIAVLHSKVSAKETENEMLKFEKGEFDVLLSTSIVESGIHMPSANTMIVDGANKFGIADLHQLRGRVGRGGKEGFCYFMVSETRVLTENATRRLLALESHSHLGSGAVLAFHDLEIRGGGNIIGEAQSGHIKQIGYSLYLRMLEDAIKELSGKEKEEEQGVDIKLAVNAYLSEDLVVEDRLRLELYRRLSLCESPGEVYEIEGEIEDRFGRLDSVTRQFIDVMVMKLLAKQKGITKVSSYGEKVFIEFKEKETERLVLRSPSKDDDDIITTAMKYLKKRDVN
jgi:transcription-repair coupling factor (superfamily II helicase)